MPLFYEDPVHITRAEGVWLYDHEGRAYLDAYNNVPSVGHCHPRVVDAVARQAAQLNTHTRYLSEVVYAYAERLLATFPERCPTCSSPAAAPKAWTWPCAWRAITQAAPASS